MKASPPDVLSDLYIAAHSEGYADEDADLFQRAHEEIWCLREDAADARSYAVSLQEPARELLYLYDWRPELAKIEKDSTADPKEVKRLLREYGERKKAGWIALRAALAKNQRHGADSPCVAGSAAPSTDASDPGSQAGPSDRPSDVQRGVAQSAPATIGPIYGIAEPPGGELTGRMP